MKNQTLKNILLLSLIVLSQLHVIFRGQELRVDWFLCIDYTRRIDYAVLYLCRYVVQAILAYCLLFPSNISKYVKMFVFILSISDLIHYLTFSSLGYGIEKILISSLIFFAIRKYV